MHTDVAIIVGCYQQEKYIKQALWSAQNQIVPVNASSSLTTLPSYQVIEHHDNCGGKGKGAANSRNQAIALADADYIIWLDADDMIISSHLYWMWYAQRKLLFPYRNRLTRGYEVPKHIVIHAPVQFISGCRLDRFSCLEAACDDVDDNSTILWQQFPFAMSAMFSKDTWSTVNGFDQSMSPMEDWDFWLRINELKESRFRSANEACMLKRDIPGSHLKGTDDEHNAKLLEKFNKRHSLKLKTTIYPYLVPATDVI